jgi:excisionase family DNA binding protein
MEKNPLLTAGDVAGYLQISRALAYRLIVEGKLPGIRFGRTVRVLEQDLIAFVQQNSTIPNGVGNKMPWR